VPLILLHFYVNRNGVGQLCGYASCHGYIRVMVSPRPTHHINHFHSQLLFNCISTQKCVCLVIVDSMLGFLEPPAGVGSTPCRCHVTLQAYQEPLRGRRGPSNMVFNRSLPNSPLHDLPLPLAGQDTWLNTIIGQPLNVCHQSSRGLLLPYVTM
jgi:hypothetical protein